MLFCSWMMQSTFLAPSDLKRAPAAWPAIDSSWPTCVMAPSSLNCSAPELSVMIGMPADLRLGQRALDRVRVRDRHGEAVDLLGDRGVDQLRLLLRVVVGRAPDQLDALVLGRLLGALLDDRPERALVAVRDHREREAAALGQVDRLRSRRSDDDLPPELVLVAAATAGHHQRAEREDDDEPSADESLHRRDTLSLRGADVDRNSMLRATSSAGPPSTGGSVAGDGQVLLEHEPALVAHRRRGARTTSSIRASPSPSGRNRPICVAWTSDSSPPRTRSRQRRVRRP